MRINKKSSLLLLLIIYISGIKAQNSTTNQNLVWYGYFLTIQHNEKWYLQTEIQERHFLNPIVQHQFLVRTHLHRVLGNSGWETSTGMCVFFQNPNNPDTDPKLTIPELRPHVEFIYKQKLKYVTFDHRYRVEARFFHNANVTKTELQDGFYYSHFRFRYRLQATIPIWKIDEARQLKIKISEEIHLNADNKIVKNIYEQNRTYLGLSMDALSNLTFDLGYLNWFQQRVSGDFYNRNILRFTIFYKINL